MKYFNSKVRRASKTNFTGIPFTFQLIFGLSLCPFFFGILKGNRYNFSDTCDSKRLLHALKPGSELILGSFHPEICGPLKHFAQFFNATLRTWNCPTVRNYSLICIQVKSFKFKRLQQPGLSIDHP